MASVQRRRAAAVKVAIVCPTVKGREDVLDATISSFEQTCPSGWTFDLIIPEDYPNVGEAWNAGMADADADYAYLAIDDATAHPGWAEVAAQTVDAGYIPAPKCLFPDGTVESCGSMGWGVLLTDAQDMTPCRNTGSIFMRLEWWEQVGPLAERHYSADDLWCWKAMLQGIYVVHRSGMVFTHHHSTAYTDHVRAQAQEHIRETLADMSRLRLPGSAYAALADSPAMIDLTPAR